MEAKEKKLSDIRKELREGMQLAKCKQCGCMKETLEGILASAPSLSAEGAPELKQELQLWLHQMEPIKYACLGCAYCYPAVAANLFAEIAPVDSFSVSSGCGFSVKNEKWPPVPGEYFVPGKGKNFPVAVSTLASAELAEKLANVKPEGLCIVGKTETENIGIDKVIKNVIANQDLRFLLLAGQDPKTHLSGRTFLSLHKNGVDEKMRVINSPSARPVLRNITRDEVEIFRNQIEVVEMIGCEDVQRLVDKIRVLSAREKKSCECKDKECESDEKPVSASISLSSVPVIRAKPPEKLALDKAGYFVILAQPEKNLIVVEHYGYDNTLLRIIEGNDAKSLYGTLVAHGWVTELSHAAYLGRELTRAEFSLASGSKYVQEGA